MQQARLKVTTELLGLHSKSFILILLLTKVLFIILSNTFLNFTYMVTLTPFTGILGDINAAHLLRRATFKPTKSLITQFASYNINQAMAALCAPLSLEIQEPLLFSTNQPYIQSFLNPTLNGSHGDPFIILSWYLREAKNSNTIHFKAAIWLHTMFITNNELPGSIAFFDYLQLLNYYSNKSLKEFAKKITRSNIMLIYLNNNENTKFAPNENYAREFLELFTILRGPQDGTGSYTTYTEYDVQQAAKVLTGFTNIGNSQRMSYLDPVSHVPLGKKVFANHDVTNKTFSSKFNNQVITGATSEAGMDAELDSFIDMVFAQQATALNYARRMYRYYVKSEITTEVETGIITPLATNLMNTNYDINSTLQLLLSSKHFFDAEDGIAYDQVFGGKIKSPVELFLMMLNQFEIINANPQTNSTHNFGFYKDKVAYKFKEMSMDLFQPLSAVGYIPVYQSPYDNLWINTAVLKTRYNNPIDDLINGYTNNGFTTKLNTYLFVKDSGNFSNPANANLLINEMLDLLLASMPTGSRYTYFSQSLLGGLSAINWQNEWNNYINTGNFNAVKVALDRFVKAIVKSPEYQVF